MLPRCKFHSATLLSAAMALSLPPSAPAQAVATATQLSHIAVFAGSEHLAPNVYGNPIEHGIVGGIDINRLGGPLPISFEARATYTPTGQFVGQRSASVGARFDLRHRHFARFKPYANFLFGVGEIVFGPSYNTGSDTFNSDNSLIFNYGAGLDYALTTSFSLQAEYQQQHWNLGNEDDPQTFRPAMINVGLRYTIPFRPRNRL